MLVNTLMVVLVGREIVAASLPIGFFDRVLIGAGSQPFA
jgi:hypothetical protein